MSRGQGDAAGDDRFDAVVRLPFGAVGVRSAGDAIVEITFLPDRVHERPARNPLAQCAVEQLLAYSADPEASFDLPLAIPCHRVIAAHGIGGFAHHTGGVHERIKRWLLAHEAQGEFQLR
jgi:methylated-DNA-[protein]-cysteine S-methyltransferase